MAITEEQRALAIGMMRDGHPPEAVHAHLVELGGANDEVYAFVSDLVRLKSEAAARDPARLREEAKWILLRGGTVEDVVAAFGAVGVAPEHARPEAERMLALVRTMRPCQRCRAPMLPNEVMFDIGGNSICARCHSRDEILRSEQRGIVSEMENIGLVSPLMGLAIATMVERSQAPAYAAPEVPAGPVCPTCRAPALVSTSTLPPHHPASTSGARWICRHCNGTC
jgi:hypothetical protein